MADWIAYDARDWNHPRMSSGVTSRKAEPIASVTAPVVRAAAVRNDPLTFENISSIGAMSGLDGGSGMTSAPAPLDRGDHRLRLVRLEVIPDHHVLGPQLRHQDLLDVAPERGRVRGPRKTTGAVTPDSRRPQITVTVSQWPGAEPWTRSPTGPRPWVRVIAVLAPLSSTKTSRRGSIPAACRRKARLFRWTSGLSRSWAWRSFFLRVILSLRKRARSP